VNHPGTPSSADPHHDTLSLPLHVETHGEEGSPLVLVHGFGANGFTWNRWLPRLSQTHRCVVVEMKGAGSSPKPRGADYGPHEQALLIHRLILQQDLRDLTLVGHSLGGGVALLTALRLQEESPGRLKGLVLVGAAAYHQPLPYFIALAARPLLGPMVLRLLPKAFLMRQGLKMAYHDRSLISESQIQAYAGPVRRVDGQHALSRMAQQIIPENLDDFVAKYPQLRVPTLLIWGRQDRIVPLRFGQRLAGELPMAQLTIMEDCGHIPHEEKPEESYEIFREFLEG
jgi:pimeloyl-ACP methyl ester carboxylesterase